MDWLVWAGLAVVVFLVVISNINVVQQSRVITFPSVAW